MKTVAIIGTFDTKGREFQFLKTAIEHLGCKTFTVHMGVYAPLFTPDVDSSLVAEAAGASLASLAEKKDRGTAMELLSKGGAILIPQLYAEGKFDAIISLGGGGGTSLATPAMQALPIGVPKIMVSTLASGDTTPYVGSSDIVMMPSIVDVSGINSISSLIFRNAACAIVGMVKLAEELPAVEMETRPLVAATMFGVTTPCVTAATAYLEEKGYEPLVFHATGVGGKNMESLVANGFIKGVLDMTTTEWCDEVCGGVLSAGDDRCGTAARCGVPTVLSVGALDMCNFGPFDTIPEKYADRNFYKHNPMVTLMRTTAEENKIIAEKIAEKVNLSVGKTAVMLPLKGVSGIDVEGAPFYGPEEDKVLFDTLRSNLDTSKIELIEMDTDINDKAFAEAAAQKLIDLMNAQG